MHSFQASNNTFKLDEEKCLSTGSFSVDEQGQMLNSGDVSYLNNAPAPCTAKCLDPETSQNTRLTNDFVHVNHNPRTPKNVIGHCKLYGLVIILALSVILNIVLLAVGIWYALTKSPQPPGYRPQPTTQKPTTDYRQYLVLPGEVNNLVAVPCNARANLAGRFPGMVKEYVNISTFSPAQPVQQYCYLPKSEHLNHFLRIIDLASKAVNGSLGVEPRHCVSLGLSLPTTNGSDVKPLWSEQGNNVPDDIFKISRNERTSELELSGPSGFYLIMASVVYKTSRVRLPTQATLAALVNGRKVIGQTKTLFPSRNGYTSLSFHDVVHIKKGDDVMFNVSSANFLYNVRRGAHTAHMCCIPALGGCKR
ncbi:uncharacterized protein LOC110467445 [Mizuhopecten yessoensis]|uniref:Uncharacterized protein n=1 Tax=Mizuhopecten yessoensis TaxID=6573 RepID=A0A210R1H6_MIZYE|nr:uncharacterized protein LOC110467445 [Mizuhopecten yessoensis]OWF54852.1 hypothetical protein KP79_PYT20838 [Mizuhopecten yessoensis]